MTRGRRRLVVVAAAVGVVVLVLAWAVPAFGAHLLVDVRTTIVPVSGDASPARSVLLSDGTATSAGKLRVTASIANHYPLAVQLGFGGSAVHASLVPRDPPHGEAVWRGSADDPSLEQSDDSPDVGSERVVSVAPGASDVPTDAQPLVIDLSGAKPIPAGIYVLRLSAYGVDAAPQLISIADS